MYIGKAGKIAIALTGDVMLASRMPKTLRQEITGVSMFLKKHDCVIGNLETTIHDGEGVPEAFPGGGWAMSTWHSLTDLSNFGFDVFACANNHSMDYGQQGLLTTIKRLNESDIPFSGIGKNLAEASSPVYFDCENGRISLISITSSFHDSYLAGPQSQDMRGRPGINPLRHCAFYELNTDDLSTLIRIANDTGINSYHAQAIKEGYIPENNQSFKFGGFSFKEGVTGRIHTSPLNLDLDRTISGIRDAKNLSDVIVISVHGHQFYKKKEQSPEFLELFAKSCIEAGANVVFCHGPHLLRGIQCYKGGIIFYGLGNFILQHDQFKLLPEEYYLKYGTTRQEVYGASEGYLLRSANNTRGLNVDQCTWESIAVGLEFDAGINRATLQPIKLDRYGLPCVTPDVAVIHRISALSEIYGTNIKIENGQGKIEF